MAFRFHWRLRTMLIAIAIVAVLLGWGIWIDSLMGRSLLYERQAYFHRLAEQDSLRAAARHERKVAESKKRLEDGGPAATGAEQKIQMHTTLLRENRQKAESFARNKVRYQHAVSYPWEPLPPDLPAPK